MRILLLIILLPHIVFAEIYKNNIPDKIKHFVSTLETTTIPSLQGGAIAILYKGEVVYKNSFGYGKENLEKITFKTLFPLASVSKVVSSAAIALMLDKNMLELGKEYTLPALKSKITIKDILGNTTGYRFSGNQDIEKGVTRKELLNKLKTLPQPCQPGKCYFYSNLCFSLIGDILEKEKFSLKYAIDELTTTLKTDEIKLVPLAQNIVVAYPHIKKKDSFVMLPFPKYYPTAVPASAGIFASIDGMIELYKFLFFYRPDLISNKMLEIFYTPYVEAYISHWKLPYEEKIESYYGLGWRIFWPKKDRNKHFIFHSGWIGGVNTLIGFIPSEEIGIIVLTNQNPPSAARIGLGFWQEFWR